MYESYSQNRQSKGEKEKNEISQVGEAGAGGPGEAKNAELHLNCCGSQSRVLCKTVTVLFFIT